MLPRRAVTRRGWVGTADEGRAGWRFRRTNDPSRFSPRPPQGPGLRVSSGGPSAHPAAQAASGHDTGPDPVPPAPSLTHAAWVPGDPATEVGGPLAGPGAQATGKPRSHEQRAVLCSGTAAGGAPSPERGERQPAAPMRAGRAGAGRGQGAGARARGLCLRAARPAAWESTWHSWPPRESPRRDHVQPRQRITQREGWQMGWGPGK